MNVSGTGTLALVPKISVTDSVPPDSDFEVPFGDVIVAPPIPSDETVTITSSGTGNLIIGTLTQPAAPFSVLNDTCSGQTLTPTSFCTLTVRFDPVTTGMFPDNFTIPSNDAGKPNTPVSLTGTGTLPVITVSDSVEPTDDLYIPYGNVIETLTAVETVTISNNSTVDLTLGLATITDPLGPFSILTNNCSTPQNIIAPGNACTIDVQFLPDSVGMFASSLNIPSNDPNTATVTVDVDGIGTPSPAPDISITDPIPPQDDLILPFGDVTEGTAWDRPVKITNEGNANLTIGAIAQLDSLAAPFSILSDTCSGQIIAPAAGAIPPPSCTIDVRFLPSTTGPFNDSFDIPSDDPDEPTLTFNVDGAGVILGTGTISLEPEGASALSPTILLALLLLFAANLRRRYHW
ncbi:MAG: choice-of-anchor D domain-containing protein [Gammaproteobacteria bacterium]|nr:choice-of-anchor D domain-containing protein [Gammaproteobacteria bacterium]